MQTVTVEVQVLLAHVIEERLLGHSWEQIATKIKRPVEEVRKLPQLYSDAWKKQRAAMKRELLDIGIAQTIVALGAALQSDDLKAKTQAANIMSRIQQTEARNKDRALKVKLAKQYEAETKPTPPAAKNTEPPTTQPTRQDVPPPTPPTSPTSPTSPTPTGKVNNTPQPFAEPKTKTEAPAPKVPPKAPRDANGFRIL